MIDEARRGYEIGRELSRLFGVPGIDPEVVREYAVDTQTFLAQAGFAHVEPADTFIENLLEGWYERVLVRNE